MHGTIFTSDPGQPSGARRNNKWNKEMTDNEIEQEIITKGLTAPRITPTMIEDMIIAEGYIEADNTFYEGGFDVKNRVNTGELIIDSLKCLTICVLVLRNGFTIVGKSACVSPKNFDYELSCKIARQDAVNQIWALEGYRLKSELSK